MNNNDSLTIFLNEISQYPLLTPEEKEKLWPLIQQGDKDAIDKMILSNTRLVVKIAKKYEGNGIPLQDLIQEGVIGLQTAVQRFDPSLGYQFSTYAAFWIKQRITKAIMNGSKMVRLPINVINDITKLNKEKQKFIEQNNRDPNFEELSRMTDLDPNKLKDVLNILRQGTYSLDQMPKQTDSDIPGLYAITPNKELIAPEDQSFNFERRDAILHVLDTLSEKEKEVIIKRFGFDDGVQKSLDQVGKMMGLTRERARQLEINALKKLRNPARKNILAEYL